jgi:hypothetical protein
MFDNLRDDSSFYEDEPSNTYKEPEAQAQPVVATSRTRKRSARFMGLTAQQRFLLAIMFLITVCVMGMLAMFVTGSMGFF